MENQKNNGNSLKEKALAMIKQEELTFGKKERYAEILKPLTWSEISVERFLREEPPEPRYIFGKLIMEGLVYGFFATGGTGKSFLLKQLAISLATARDFGPFKPVRKFKVLYIGAEDPEWKLHRRIHLIAKKWGLLQSQDLINNLAVYSAVGKIEPLLMLNNNNPITTLSYEWLQKTIESINDLELLILDPMSRLYGLNENDNAHGTAWIQCLERLNQTYNLSTWFSHHEPKSASQNRNLKDSTGRGAGSIRDGCRGSISMREMTDSDGKKYEVNPREFIELDISKANYTAKLPSSIFLKRGDGGLLEPANLKLDRVSHFTELLVSELSELTNNQLISRSDLKYKKNIAKPLIKKLEELDGFKHSRDIDEIINYGLGNGLLYEVDEIRSDKTGPPKKILKVKYK